MAFPVRGAGLLGVYPLHEVGEQFDHVVALGGDNVSFAAPHLEFGVPDDGQLRVKDRGSRTGTAVVVDDVRIPVLGDSRVPAPLGARIEVGDAVVHVDPPGT